MKKLIATTLASALVGLAAFGQGTVNFQNVAPGVNVPVLMSDGATKVSGANWEVALWAGPTAASMAQIATATFGAAGYFLGGVQTIGTVTPGNTAFIEIQVWDTTHGATFAAAQAAATAGGLGNVWALSNQGTPFTVVTGGAGSPPSTPGNFVGLVAGEFRLNSVPEPSTLALAGLGAAALTIFRRRK